MAATKSNAPSDVRFVNHPSVDEMVEVAQMHVDAGRFEMAHEVAEHARWVVNAMERTGRRAWWDVRAGRVVVEGHWTD